MKNSQVFRDDFKSRYSFADEFIVVCPRCLSRAKVVPSVPWTSKNLFGTKRKLICGSCGYNQEKLPARAIALHADRDWFFGEPLYYAIVTPYGNLYAYNDEHLNYLEEIIQAKMRTRRRSEEFGWSNRSQLSRLPHWAKLQKNRPKILAAIKKLREKG